ncbi:MAG: hypothetical protein AB1333_01905 [Patescibacteria group bacterium]
MKNDEGVLKKSELKEGVTYIVCPDPMCKLFFCKTRRCPCISECPMKEKRKLIFLCPFCNDLIIHDGCFNPYIQHITHECVDTGMHPIFFAMDNPLRLLYEIPT